MNPSQILGIIPGLQATALVSHNIPKFDMKKTSPKMLVKTGVTTLVGIGLIKPTAQMINTL